MNIKSRQHHQLTLKNTARLIVSLFVLLTMGCTETNEIGSKKNPLKFYLIPAQDMMTLRTQGDVLGKYLAKELAMHVEIGLPTNFIAVVEAEEIRQWGLTPPDMPAPRGRGMQFVVAPRRAGAIRLLKQAR